MALVLKAENIINNEADRAWLTEKSGLYDVTTNPGGWGTPNPDQNVSALVAIAIRKQSVADELLVSVGSAAYFNASAANSDEHVFEFLYINDGVHDFYLIRVPVTADGVTDLESNALGEGDYFYLTGSNDIYQRLSSLNVLVTDYTVLIDIVQSDVIQVLCQNHYAGLGNIARQIKYREYKAARTSVISEDPLFLEVMEMTLDIKSQYDTFISGLLVDAQRQAETFIDEHNLANSNDPQPAVV